jgi:hypothetical protein
MEEFSMEEQVKKADWKKRGNGRGGSCNGGRKANWKKKMRKRGKELEKRGGTQRKWIVTGKRQ